MALTLLSETLGEDTTTQLLRDQEGAYHVRIMALNDPGEAQANEAQATKVLHEQPIALEEARSLFNASAANRFMEATSAFPT